jgi:pimeloyl-ACP methyl ester carboxylesterase
VANVGPTPKDVRGARKGAALAVSLRRCEEQGTKLDVREVRSGPQVLLINGVGAHAGMWEELERALDGFRLIEFDAPGTGRSGSPVLPVPIATLAWMAARILDKVAAQRADVPGYSMGGLVAQHLALIAPQRVRRLVLVATSCGVGAVPGRWARCSTSRLRCSVGLRPSTGAPSGGWWAAARDAITSGSLESARYAAVTGRPYPVIWDRSSASAHEAASRR